MTDLDKLIAAVEAGTLNAFTCGATVDAYPADFPFDGEGLTLTTTLDAYRGSLDAALRLHEALLPGWAWALDAGDGASVENRADFGDTYSTDASRGPIARCWLLAILRALKAKGDA